MTSKLDWTLDTLFLYLSHSTMCISEEDKHKVFNDMAYKLMEWNNTSRCELRVVFRKLGCKFIEFCSKCYEEIESCHDVEEPLCTECYNIKENVKQS